MFIFKCIIRYDIILLVSWNNLELMVLIEYNGIFLFFGFLKRLVLVENIVLCNSMLYFLFSFFVLIFVFFVNIILGVVVKLNCGFLKIIIFLF